MASKTRIEFVSEGFAGILSDDETRKIVEDYAQSVCDRANSDTSGSFSVETDLKTMFKTARWRSCVVADDNQASRDESEDKVLTRAIQ